MISTYYNRIWMNDSCGHVTILSTHFFLEDAVKARSLSGDLIVDDRGMLLDPELWFFEWEKNDPNCYARKKFERQQKTGRPVKVFNRFANIFYDGTQYSVGEIAPERIDRELAQEGVQLRLIHPASIIVKIEPLEPVKQKYITA